ncbi:TIGR02099 family protein [Methylobacillus rhizosphaerae]|uniref:TIGR02099 family protein n=1 Tax=Methylobacillus rhizosphaerae TaxID=551994 RepID=A0A238YGB8_9PROT|nr:YhdP family protein [Methylobacillus rhizosphaerae]SNR69848.1 TIGR02099 family protein [Methylobacillus rhizosphaerae]
MVKKSLLWCYRATLAALWFIIIAFSIIVLSLRYLVLPSIDDYRERIAAKVSTVLGQPVTIKHLYASWDGLNPRLVLRDIDIYDQEQRVALSFKHIEASISWLSIPLLEPRLSSFIIHDPELSIRREPDGIVYIAGVATNGPARPEFANWLLRQTAIDVRNATISWHDNLRQAPPLILDNLNLHLENPALTGLIGQHRFGLQAVPSLAASGPIDIRGNLYGKDVSKLQEWRGTLYAHADGIDVAAWQQWLPSQFMEISRGHGAARVWLEFADGAPGKVTSDVILYHVTSQIMQDQPAVKLDALSGRLGWIRHKDGQEFTAKHLKLATPEGLDMQRGNIAVRTQISGTQSILSGSVALDEISLASAHILASHIPLPEQAREALDQINPEGDLQKLNLSWTSRGGFPEKYHVQTQFNDLGMRAYQKIPGFKQLSGSVNADETSGILNLNTHHAELNFKDILRWPIPVTKLTGQVKWKTNDGKPEIRVNNLNISNAHLAGAVNASFQHQDSKGGMLELIAKFNRVDGKYARFYYPHILGEHTTAWLDDAILAGKSEDVSVIIKGNMHDFPFAGNKNGLFQVKAKIHDGSLKFASEWPDIENIALDMLFEGNRMELNANKGTTLGTQVVKSKVTIPDLAAHQPVLTVVSEGQGPVSNGIQYLNSSPLAEITGGFTHGLKTSGDGKLSLDLQIPLHDVNATKVKGSYTITNGSLASQDIPALSRINGKLDFTEHELRGQNLSTWVYGGPAQVSLNTGKDNIVNISARGQVNDSGLRAAFGPGPFERIFGTTDWNGNIVVGPNGANITIHSNLQGITSSLPYPLNKTMSDTAALKVERKQANPLQDTINISYGNALGAILMRGKQSDGSWKLLRGDIGFNVAPTLPQQTGLTIHGSMDHLDIDEWREIAGKQQGNNQAAIDLQRIDLDINKLDAFDRRINELKMAANSISGGWQMQVQSKELTGNIQWLSQGNGKVVARLQRLSIPSSTPDTATLRTQGQFNQPGTVTEYPSLDIIADRFEYGTKQLGKLELLANEHHDDWSIEKLRISTPESELNADGEWHNWKRRPNTRLNINWKISDVGQTLESFGYPNTIKGGTADLTGQLKWPGSPHDFDTTLLSGNLQLDVRKGQILKIQPGVGRLFSVLTLQNLPRRLSFDFRDVFSSGFTFDKIDANVRIDDGIMRSDNFHLEGPTASVTMTGETNLQKETQHIKVKVTPYVSDSLSIAALAGGPVVGAATYLAQKLLKDPLNQIASSEYEFVGTWDNPVEVKNGKGDNKTPEASPLGK